MLWKVISQQFIVKDIICMKKHLAICSIFFTVCAALTGCGNNNDGHYTDDENGMVTEHSTTDRRYEETTKTTDKTIKDRLDDAADGAGEAGKDIVSGVGDAGKELINGAKDAVDDVIDGMDGEKASTTVTATTLND